MTPIITNYEYQHPVGEAFITVHTTRTDSYQRNGSSDRSHNGNSLVPKPLALAVRWPGDEATRACIVNCACAHSLLQNGVALGAELADEVRYGARFL